MSDSVSLETVDALCAAFNRHDLDAVLEFFADDAVFIHATGKDGTGHRFEGKQAIAKVFAGLFQASPDIQWIGANTVCGDRAISEWRRTATGPNGEKQDWLGCDLYTFRDGKVVVKDVFFKIVE